MTLRLGSTARLSVVSASLTDSVSVRLIDSISISLIDSLTDSISASLIDSISAQVVEPNYENSPDVEALLSFLHECRPVVLGVAALMLHLEEYSGAVLMALGSQINEYCCQVTS